MPSASSSRATALALGQRLGVDPEHVDLRAVVEAAVPQRLDHGQVGVRELHVLADKRDPTLPRRLGAPHHRLPLAHVGRRRLDAEVVQQQVVEALGAEHQRDLVDVVDVAGRDHRVDRQAREQRDLGADVARQRLLGAAHDHVGLDADPAQLVDRVLGGLGLQLAGVADERHQRQVDEEAALAAQLDLQLADRLQERQRLDVAHRAADLGDDEVDVLRLGDQLHAMLDLVGDVRDHLHGPAQEVARRSLRITE